jgi:hypothetical protein
MNGIPQENDMVDDTMEECSIYSEKEGAADDFTNGTSNEGYQFICAGGVHLTVIVVDNPMFMFFLGQMAKQTYTPKIEPAATRRSNVSTTQCFPLNPLRVLSQVWFAVTSVLESNAPSLNYSVDPILDVIKTGIYIDANVWHQVALALYFLFDCTDTASWIHVHGVGRQSLESQKHKDQSSAKLLQDGAHDQAHRISMDSNQLLLPGSVQGDPIDELQTLGLPNAMGRLSEASPKWAKLTETEIKAGLQVDTVNLRRSTRATKYDGFKLQQPTDRRKVVSKVKPRKIPSAAPAAKSYTALLPPIVTGGWQTVVIPPPPTKIEEIQDIGTRMCGITPDDLSPKRLLDPRGGEDTSN